MFAFSQHLNDDAELRSRTANFQAAMPIFYERHVASFDARMTNMSNLRERDALVEELVSSVLLYGEYRPNK